MNLFNIERAFRRKKERDWDYLFWAIDIHDVLFPGQYASDQEFHPYNGSIEVLKWISDRSDQKIIIWTSSYSQHFDDVKKFFAKEHSVWLDFHNCNPICSNTDYADFTTKFYFNILLDDKSGMEGDTDWYLIKEELQRIGEWDD